MEKLLKVADMRALEKKVCLGEISYTKMIEIINMKHFKALIELRHGVANGKFVWKSFEDKKPIKGRKIIWWGRIYGFEEIEWYRNCNKFLNKYGISHWCYTKDLPKPIFEQFTKTTKL